MQANNITSAPLIEFEDATLMRDETPGLENLTLRINQGEHVAILGPNGSGKSTFIKAITRELYPLYREGSSAVRIMGQDTWNVAELRTHLGIVSNDWLQICTCSFPSFEIIISGFHGSVGIWPYHTVTAEQEQRTRDIMETLEITHLADRPVNALSSGEARRVLIARALVHQPGTLLLDEPTASLDIRATHELLTILKRLSASGTSMLMVTHHLPDILPEIERVVLMRRGKLFMDGPKRQVLKASVLSELFEMPVELLERNGHYHLL